jgi:hypothetical protein
MENESASRAALGKATLVRMLQSFTAVAALLFLSAGTVDYREA